MLSINTAERILAPVTTRDRAMSTIGDLAEGAATRGVLWFWSTVLRTAASLLWRDIAEQPVRVTVPAFVGLAIYIALDVVFAGVSGIAFFLAALATDIHSIRTRSGGSCGSSLRCW